MKSRLSELAFGIVWRVLAFLGISRLDYYRHYARSDIDRKYKTLTGCTSEKEFDQTGKLILERLISLGFKQNSKILDLGCGTGRLAAQLLPYLGEQGEYYGCDISPEVIEFCRKRYARSNFHFVTSQMRKIPISLDAHFDIIWCYSVFTHIFPDEMIGLLKECRRLMRSQGLLLASYYIAGREPAFLKRVESFYGNRDRMEYGEDFLREIIGNQGFFVLDTISIQKQPIFVLKLR
jgi:ubiquinone/menaquinone biosynthesis C-methylase UbiE